MKMSFGERGILKGIGEGWKGVTYHLRPFPLVLAEAECGAQFPLAHTLLLLAGCHQSQVPRHCHQGPGDRRARPFLSGMEAAALVPFQRPGHAASPGGGRGHHDPLPEPERLREREEQSDLRGVACTICGTSEWGWMWQIWSRGLAYLSGYSKTFKY